MRLLLTFFSFLFSLYSNAETFSVALSMLPDINPITNQINSGNYIGSHLYYPLFERKSDNTFDSYFLDIAKSKSLTEKFDEFQLCLKKNIEFVDKSPIRIDDLISSIHAYSLMYPQTLSIKNIETVNGDCLRLSLQKSAPGLFAKLTGIASTILKKESLNDNFPVGVGPYKLMARTETELLLETTSLNKPRFDKILFKLVKKVDDDVSKFSDINQLPPNLERDYKYGGEKIEAPSLKVYSFVINVKNPNLRDQIRFYLEEHAWENIFGLNLVKSKYFLPWLNSTYNITNKKSLTKPKYKISFIIPDFYDTKKIEKVIEASYLNELLKVVSLPSSEFAKWAFSGKEYVGLMGFDSSGSISSLEGDFSVYFESFFSRSSRIVTKPILPIKEAVKNSSNINLQNRDRQTLIRRAEKYLSDHDFISPLGKVKRTFVFPSDIQITAWYDFFSGIPKIHRIQ